MAPDAYHIVRSSEVSSDIVILAEAGWPKLSRYRVHLTSALRDEWGRYQEEPVVLELDIPEELPISGVLRRELSLEYDNVEAA